jgi:eukaryotic-like serine/threonine-protein kinase
MGGSGEPTLTLASERRAQTFEERKAAFARLFLIGCFAWPPFAIVDVLGAQLAHDQRAIPALLTVRGIGEGIAIVLYLAVKRGNLTPRALTLMDYLAWVMAGGFLSAIGVELGGLSSPNFAGIMLMVVARAALIPSHWLRALTAAGMAALAWPLVLGLAALFIPEIAAQWRSPQALGQLAYGVLFILGALGLCSAGSHALWNARSQVHEARRLGAYRLKVRIGSGGNGDVWVARQDALQRDVALKVLKDTGTANEEKVRRFEREAQAAASLAHPNTIRIFEFGASDDGVLFIAMELLDGLDIDALVEVAGPLPPARAVKLIRQACASLAEAHVKKIVHRDIKPGNLFVTHAGEEWDFVKLLDFGVARLGEQDGPSLTETGILFGTPAYMPPEVCNGERASTRSDIYSLGAVLYYMLTGTPLFPDRTFAETVMSHINRIPDRPSVRLGTPLSPGLEAIVMKCLEKTRDARFRSARELDEALAGLDDVGDWSREDARLWWTGARNSLAMRVRGAA